MSGMLWRLRHIYSFRFSFYSASPRSCYRVSVTFRIFLFSTRFLCFFTGNAVTRCSLRICGFSVCEMRNVVCGMPHVMHCLLPFTRSKQ